MFRGIQIRRLSFLAEPEWLQQPWASTTKDPYDQLIDILLQAPRIYTDSDAVDHETRPHAILSGLLHSVNECWRFDGALQGWQSRLADAVPGALYWPCLATVRTPADTATEGMVFPVAYQFPSLVIATGLVLCWSFSTILHQYMCHLYDRIEELARGMQESDGDPCLCRDDAENTAVVPCPAHFTPDRLPPLGPRKDWGKNAARDVCQSIEYFLQDSMKCAGPASILPALLGLAWLWDHDNGNWSRELTWVTYMIGKVHSRGNAIAVCTDLENLVTV
jgi:hypothetical protein